MLARREHASWVHNIASGRVWGSDRFVAGESLPGHHLDGSTKGCDLSCKPVDEHLFGPPRGLYLTSVLPGVISHRGEVDDHRDLPVAPAGMMPDVFIYTKTRTSVRLGCVKSFGQVAGVLFLARPQGLMPSP